MEIMKIKEIREYVKTLDVPERDVYELPTSEKTFPDGSHYRLEAVPFGLSDTERLFSIADKYNFVINKITECSGIMCLNEKDILKMCELCRDRGVS